MRKKKEKSKYVSTAACVKGQKLKITYVGHAVCRGCSRWCILPSVKLS